MEQKRTIERLWRDAVAAGRTTPAYLIQDGDEWRPLSWAEAAERVESYANGLLSLGVRKGDAFAILGSSRVEWALFDFALGSVGAIGAAIYANSSPKDAGYILAHSESVGVLFEDEAQRAKVESVRSDAPNLRHVLTYADLEDLAARGRAYAAEHPNALREAGERIEEGDLFTYIYTSGTTGPPKGCMISHLNYYAMARSSTTCPTSRGRRLDAPLPPARAQLRPADAPLRRLRRLRDRVPARSAAGRRGPPGGEADRLPERAPRLREDAHRCRREVRRRDRREAEADPLGARRRPPGERPAPRRKARAGEACWCSTGSPTGSSTRRSRSGSAAACGWRSRAARRSRRRSRSSSTRSASSSSRATA